MNLLILAPASNVHTLRWCNAFDQMGHKVYLASQHKKINGYNEDIEFIDLPVKNIFGYYLNSYILERKVKDLNIDVVNIHYASGYGTLGRLLGFVNTVVTTWGSDILIYPKKNIFNKKILIKNLRCAKKITAASYILAQETSLYTKTKVDIVPFGVVVNDFKKDLRNLCEKIKNDEKIYIGTVKSLEDVYGIDILIRAFHFLITELLVDKKELSKKLYLKIVGDGSLEKKYKKLAVDLNIHEKIIFKPKVQHSKVKSELDSLDIFCALSRSESFGVSVVEAGINKLPIIVTEVGGFKELISNHYNGILVPNEDFRTAARALLFILNNPILAQEIGENAYTEFSQKFDWNNNVKSMLDIFYSLSES